MPDSNDSYVAMDLQITINQLRSDIEKYQFMIDKLAQRLSMYADSEDSDIPPSAWIRWAFTSYQERKNQK